MLAHAKVPVPKLEAVPLDPGPTNVECKIGGAAGMHTIHVMNMCMTAPRHSASDWLRVHQDVTALQELADLLFMIF
jgi:hypothetical protein